MKQAEYSGCGENNDTGQANQAWNLNPRGASPLGLLAGSLCDEQELMPTYSQTLLSEGETERNSWKDACLQGPWVLPEKRQ